MTARTTGGAWQRAVVGGTRPPHRLGRISGTRRARRGVTLWPSVECRQRRGLCGVISNGVTCEPATARRSSRNCRRGTELASAVGSPRRAFGTFARSSRTRTASRGRIAARVAKSGAKRAKRHIGSGVFPGESNPAFPARWRASRRCSGGRTTSCWPRMVHAWPGYFGVTLLAASNAASATGPSITSASANPATTSLTRDSVETSSSKMQTCK